MYMLAATLTYVKFETLVDTLHEVGAEAVVDRLADRLR